MSYRIMRIRGRGAAGRAMRLAAAQAWMAARGWTLVDYGEQSRQALFEPKAHGPEAPGMRPWPWQVPPGFWAGLREEWLTPRNVIVAGLAVAVLVTLFAINAQRSRFDAREAARAVHERWWIVDADNLNVREQPAAEAPAVGILQRGQRVLVGDRRNDWIEVVQPERGWVAEKFLKPPQEGGGG